jgi:hypothetical protein
VTEAGLLDPDDDDPLLNDKANNNFNSTNESEANELKQKEAETQQEIPANLTPGVLTLPGIKEALFRRAGVAPIEKKEEDDSADGCHAERYSGPGRNPGDGERKLYLHLYQQSL